MACSICKSPGHNKRTCSGANGTDTNSQPGTSKHLGKSDNVPQRGLSTSVFSVDSVESKMNFDMKLVPQIGIGDSETCKYSSYEKGSVNSKAKVNSTKKMCELCEEDDHFLGSCPLLSAILKPKIVKKLQHILCKDKEKVSDVPVPSSKAKKPGIKWLNEEALNRLVEGPSKADGPGYIYMYTEAVGVSTLRAFKIGLSEKLPDRRIHIQELKNKKEYVNVFSIETPFRYMTETVIHKQLSAYHTPKSTGDGRTEWFTGKRDFFEETIRRVRREVKGLHSE